MWGGIQQRGGWIGGKKQGRKKKGKTKAAKKIRKEENWHVSDVRVKGLKGRGSWAIMTIDNY